MHLTLRYPNGLLADALMLMRGEAFMRVVLHGRNETSEFHYNAGQWLAENGDCVSIEAILDYQGGLQANTKYSTTPEIAKTASAAAFFSMD